MTRRPDQKQLTEGAAMDIIPHPTVANATATTNPCPTWCLRHDPGVEELCIGPSVELDFGQAHPDNPQGARDARILSYNEPGNVVTLSLIVNGDAAFDMTPQQARQIGAALIQAANNATVEPLAGPHLTLVPGGAR